MLDDSTSRTIHVTIDVPTMPRNLVAYMKELPNMLAWKQAVIDHTIQLN